LDWARQILIRKYFKATITKIGFVENSELNEEFFKIIFPGKEIKTIEEFRELMRKEIQKQWDNQARNQLQHGLYHELLEHTQIDFPEKFLKRWLLTGGEKHKTEDEVEQEYPSFTNQLKWTLIQDKIFQENNLEVSGEDIKALARQQLLGYLGMQSVDENQPWISDYIQRMMKDSRFVEDAVHRIRTSKVLDWAEGKVNAVDKEITREDFLKMQDEHEHHHH
jgi:trigger factor